MCAKASSIRMKKPNSKEIYLALKEEILSLKLHPGQMISENEIAEFYSVSRTPVKNALIRLEGEGFIEVIPQRGSFVTLIDYQHIQDFVHMRYVLEMDMLKTILKELPLQELAKKLEENLREQEQLIARGQATPLSFFALDSQFHALFFSCMGRERLWGIIQANQVYYTRFRLLDTRMTARYVQLYQEHTEILQALRARDQVLLDQRVYEHLHRYLAYFSKTFPGKHGEYLTNYNRS